MKPKKKEVIRRQNDILWKGMLEEVFDDLLRFVFPRAERIFDLKRGFEYLDKELAAMNPKPDRKSDTRFVDKLVKVYLRDGSEEWILCHVEVQGADDKDFAKRMFKYYARVFDRFDKPLTAIAIFTGKDGKSLPGMYIRKYEGAELTYKYNTLCILDYGDRSLAANRNPFALVMLAAKKALLSGKDLDQVLLKEKLAIAKMLIKRGYSEEKTNGILSFLHNYVRFAEPETNRIFEAEIDRLTGKINTMGIIEQVKQMKLEEAKREGLKEGKKVGVKEGEEKRNRLFVANLLTSTSFSVAKIATLAGVTEAYVNSVKASIAK
jgi:predicted transposase/invertase (TIGR01784 family)